MQPHKPRATISPLTGLFKLGLFSSNGTEQMCLKIGGTEEKQKPNIQFAFIMICKCMHSYANRVEPSRLKTQMDIVLGNTK